VNLKRFIGTAGLALVAAFSVVSVSYAASPTPSPSASAATKNCSESVLADPSNPIKVCSDTTITTYLVDVLERYRALILTVMTLYVVASGVQYMLSQGKADAQKAAKQRIMAMITGIIFFTLVNLIASVLGGVR
jgi:hypothetical protein